MKNIPKCVYLFVVIVYLYPARMITLFIVLPIYCPYVGSATHVTNNLCYDPIYEMSSYPDFDYHSSSTSNWSIKLGARCSSQCDWHWMCPCCKHTFFTLPPVCTSYPSYMYPLYFLCVPPLSIIYDPPFLIHPSPSPLSSHSDMSPCTCLFVCMFVCIACLFVCLSVLV